MYLFKRITRHPSTQREEGTMDLHPTIVQRLAFVRYVYRVGMEQSEAPEPLCGLAILTLQDAVELFLLLCAEKLNASKKDLKFMEYWDVLSERLGKELPYRAPMRRLNEARRALKHHGVLPSRLEVESHRTSVRGFLEDVTALVFNEDFNSISLSSFVEPEAARNHLVQAERLLAQGDLQAALVEVALSFQIMLDDYIMTHRGRSFKPLFEFGDNMTFVSSARLRIDRATREGYEWAKFVDGVLRYIRDSREALTVMAIGLDYRRYARFRSLTPIAARTAAGTYVVERVPGLEDRTADDVRFCCDFVVEAALKMREFAFPSA